jgi:hypothetical protein
MEHRGEIVEKVVRTKGISLTILAKKLGKTRQWLYLVFDNPNVPLDVVLSIGRIIYYDFSKDISDLVSFKSSNINDDVSKSTDFQYWKDKYYELVDEHLAVIKQLRECEKKKV